MREMDGSAQLFRELASGAVELAARYYDDLPGTRITPIVTAESVRKVFDEPVPRGGCSLEETLAGVRRLFERSRHNGHPRFFGYVASPGTPAAAVGDLLTAVLNSNVTSWRSGPAGTEVEHVAIEWIKELVGFDRRGAGLFVSGGSMANFACIAAARCKADPDFRRRGGAGGPRLRMYVSSEAHYSNAKAAELLGIGSENVRTVRVDGALRMDTGDLRRAMAEDTASGCVPFCVVASAGTVNTGAVDPIAGISAAAREFGAWLHVDGAYGGFAAMAPGVRALFTGIGEADSMSLDPHKWLYSSNGCGCALYRDPASARAAFSHDADYTRVIGLGRDESFAFWDYGPELSRRFRALSVWMQFKVYGADALAAAIDRNVACAKRLEQLVAASDDFEMLAPVELSIFCFAHRPRRFLGDIDGFNQRVLVALQRGGRSYVSNASVHGRFALRGCVLNYRTTEDDMAALLDDVRAAGRAVSQSL